jgi:hypothetical protein
MPLRWGPSREPGEGIKVGASVIAIIRSLVHKPTADGHESGKP